MDIVFTQTGYLYPAKNFITKVSGLLEEITEQLSKPEENFMQSLETQKALLHNKRDHLDQVIHTITHIQGVMKEMDGTNRRNV